MGGGVSKSGKDNPCHTVELVANYVSMTKEQLVDLRDRCYRVMDSKRKIDRRSFNINVQKSKIKESPDAEILDCLFTMWDLRGDDRILCPPFILSLAPLACPNDDFRQILTFALSLFSRETDGTFTADQTVFILKHLNQTAAYFGDSIVSLREIYKVVDSVYGTMSIISQDGPTLGTKELVDELVNDPVLKRFINKHAKAASRVTFSPVSRVRREDGSEFSTDTMSIPLTPVAKLRLAPPKKSSLKQSASRETLAAGEPCRQ